MADTDTETGNGAGAAERRPLGFLACWSLTAGGMIGSGIFLLPTVLAPYGLMSFGGWLLTAFGTVVIALSLARLAGRTDRTGGPYRYAHDAFGDLTGFLVGWGYWLSVVMAAPAVSIAFVGYLTVFLPGLSDNPWGQAGAALAMIWTLVLIQLRGVGAAGAFQIVTTLLKIIPLLIVIGLGAASGATANLPEFNPTGGQPLQVLAATSLIVMWAFLGVEASTIPAGEIRDARRTIPRALILAVLAVSALYIFSTGAVMLLLPADALAASTAPFSDAVARLGAWAPLLIAAGAMVSTTGAANTNVLLGGQMPMAVALDGLAPSVLARKNKGHTPVFALLVSASLGSVMLLMNYSRGLVGAFTFLLMMSTLFTLAPLLVSALAEFRQSRKTDGLWSAVALLGAAFSIFAILGAGLEALLWGLALGAAGLPVYWFGRKKATPAETAQ